MFTVKIRSVDGNGKSRIWHWTFDRFQKIEMGLKWTNGWMLEKAREHWVWVDSGVRSVEWEIVNQTS